MFHSFNSYYEDREWKPGPDAVTPFHEVLRKIINMDCSIEVIGCWIYCLNSGTSGNSSKPVGIVI
jgi:hypothetical protein